MNKLHYFLKLLPCRPSFAQDMTDGERAIMMQHIAYWSGWMEKGAVIAFGPVMDPQGTYGIGIVEVDNEEQVKELIANDPAATINTYGYHPMRAVLPQKK